MAHYDERLKSGGLVLSGVLGSLVVLGKKTYMRITAGAFGGPISRRLGAESGLGVLVLSGLQPGPRGRERLQDVDWIACV